MTEALRRGHDVTRVTRSPRPDFVAADATDPAQVARLARSTDVVISATRPVAGAERDLVVTAKALLEGLREDRTRLIVVGGAATLRTPNGVLVHEEPGFPAEILPIALACAEQHAVFAEESEVDWTYASPPALIEPGERTGAYRLGRDDLLVDGQGVSAISMEDFAVALLDEVAEPRHRRERFTVAY
ncbi:MULTISPECIES: NAD(P)-dependent oxidoreductase [unclassified Saccharothrix]|uniref:NAD(P)-dependent oxidoreductase n=1 Tax=unclassified Saccharothrix TaxID=2593673 RepID=UPI00307E3F18